MKKNLLVTFIILSVVSITQAQIPNAGFENWTAGEPDAWTTNNFESFITTTQSNSSHSGSSALKGEVIAYLPPFAPTWGPSVICDNGDGTGFSIPGRFNSLKGFYKFNAQGNDKVFINVIVEADSLGVGGGAIFLDAAASYTEFGVPIGYSDPIVTPNRCVISIQIFNSVTIITPTLGSEMYIDDLQLSMDIVSNVGDELQPSTFQLEQNYPNPFNPSTKIEYSIPEESFVELKIYNLIGQEVATLVNQNQNVGTYRADFNAEGMNSGIYIAKLNVNGFTRIVKMTLLK